jgi:hypothetical protein
LLLAKLQGVLAGFVVAVAATTAIAVLTRRSRALDQSLVGLGVQRVTFAAGHFYD